jgi:hypothetical protein
VTPEPATPHPAPEPAAADAATPETARSQPATPDAATPATAAPEAATAEPAAPEPPAPEPAAELQREVTVVPGVPRYHNAQCILIRFMGQGDLEKMTLAAARESGCTPCRACQPDQPEKNPALPAPEPELQAEIRVRVFRRGRTVRRTGAGSEVHRKHLGGDQLRVLGQGLSQLLVA